MTLYALIRDGKVYTTVNADALLPMPHGHTLRQWQGRPIEELVAVIEEQEQPFAVADGFSAFAAFDHDGDGLPGGSLPKEIEAQPPEFIREPPKRRGRPPKNKS